MDRRLTLVVKSDTLALLWKNILTGNLHINSLKCKLYKTIGILSKIQHYAPKFFLNTLYYTMFHSNLIYSSQIWGQNNTILTIDKHLECLVLWEQFPCFSLQISWMPLYNLFFCVNLCLRLVFYFSLLYKDNNLYTIIIVWNFNALFYTLCFLKFFILVCVLSKL